MSLWRWMIISRPLAGRPGRESGQVSAVRILSVHGAKGLEFDFVVIADAVDGRFPQNCPRLDPALPKPTANSCCTMVSTVRR